jgi:hypothetical protein
MERPPGRRDIDGTVFKLNSDGTGFTVLKWFSTRWKAPPSASEAHLVFFRQHAVWDDILWRQSAAPPGFLGYGTVFKVNFERGSGYTVLKEFTTNGAHPTAGPDTLRQHAVGRRFWRQFLSAV